MASTAPPDAEQADAHQDITFERPPVFRPASHLGIHELLAGRWSPRAIDPDRNVDPVVTVRLLEAARWAPSSANEQPWRFLVFDHRCAIAREQARGCLNDGNAWARTAPILIAAIAQKVWLHREQAAGKPHAGATYDLGAASLSLVLQAAAEGLVAHQMRGFDADRAHDVMALPNDFDIVAMVAIGHPGRVDELPDKDRVREGQARRRRPVGKIAFLGSWGRGLDDPDPSATEGPDGVQQRP